MLGIKPDRPDVRNVRSIYAAFSKHADQSVRQSRFAPKSAKTASYSPSSTHNPPDTVGNLFFDGLSPVTRVKFAGRELDFILAQLPQFEVV